MTQQARLSKSQYVKGAQCGLNLWYSRNRKDLATPVDAGQQAIFDTGSEIGEWAKRYFPGGVEVKAAYYDSLAGADATAEFISAGYEVIFEATALHPGDQSHSRIDILQKLPGTDTWNLIEVKSSTSVKDYHIDDMAFQYRVFTGAGYKISRCFMMLIDNQYVRQGAVDPQRLFRLEDITRVVLGKQAEVERQTAELSGMLDASEEPKIKIGARCFKPFDCGFIHHCWREVPDYSIYNVYDAKKAEEIVENLGSYEVGKLPVEKLPTGLKGKDVRSYISGDVHVEPENIRQFLAGLRYPLYFLDYETIGSAVPAFDGTRPFQTIPFQFSLHIEDSPGAVLRHFEFLHREKTDPRLPFVEALIRLCGNHGTVVTYNQAFEQGVNKELMQAYPAHADSIAAINARMVDLLIPFRKRWLYHPSQHGSASIKKVLPAFTDLSYDGMGIDNGMDASLQYAAFMQGKLEPAAQEALWQNLTAYCGLDTLAMKALVDVLKKKSGTAG
ncbi:MAG TPA: DUF2779 domain-containing protein [Micavibrio sp.]|jgi:hypothetical protein